MAVNTAAVKPGDIVECDVRGRKFFAVVAGAPTKQKGVGYIVTVEPITKGINHYRVRGREICSHYRKLGRTRA